MLSTPQKHSATAGFSLVEALVALAIAALLAAVLTRFVSGTRINALKIREQLAIDTLSDNLLEQVGARELEPGRTDGRIGVLQWRLQISPVPVYARAISISEKKSNPSDIRQSSATPLSTISNEANTQPATPQPKSLTTWKVYRLAGVISAPSGRSHAIETIKILPQKAPRDVQADQR
jgi:prepilin-type N-terminal cleavage/methylation domain-containing protein